ncbi:MAG: hypothetical protein Kow0058_10370 [Roseovarius sp.]
MSEIDELQGRIAAALDRIGKGIEQIGRRAAVDPEELATLRQELEDERIANAQLQERIKVLKSRRDALEAELAAARQGVEDMQRLDAELQGLREANERLRAINARLREANAQGLADPGQINEAMRAELDALRAARAAERAETAAIYGALAQAVGATGAAGVAAAAAGRHEAEES